MSPLFPSLPASPVVLHRLPHTHEVSAETRRLLFEDFDEEDFPELEADRPAKILDFVAFRGRRAG
jgi:hypothetical protein